MQVSSAWHHGARVCSPPTTGRCNATFEMVQRLSGHGKCFPDGDPHGRDPLQIARLPEGVSAREYSPEDLPRTQHGNSLMLKLPTFPNADRPLLDQYIVAFQKVVANAAAIIEAKG